MQFILFEKKYKGECLATLNDQAECGYFIHQVNIIFIRFVIPKLATLNSVDIH